MSASSQESKERIPTHFNLISFSDTHGADLAMSKLYTATKSALAKSGKPILLVAGDIFGSNKWISSFSKGESDIALLIKIAELFPEDSRFLLLGNHDFNYGPEKILDLIEKAHFTVIASNATFAETSPLRQLAQTSACIKNNNASLIIYGLMTPETLNNTFAKKEIALIDASPQKVIQLTQSTPDHTPIIFMSHLGLADDKILASKIFLDNKNIVGIVGGHSHEEGIEQQSDQYIINNGCSATHITSWQISATKINQPQLLDCSLYPADQEVLAILNEYQRSLEQQTGMPAQSLSQPIFAIAKDSKPLGGLELLERDVASVEGQPRVNDCKLMRLTADAIAKKFQHFAVIPAAALRVNLQPGQIATLKDVYELFFGDNKLLAIRVTGKELVYGLTQGVLSNFYYWRGRGKLLHVSEGIEYGYSISGDPGSTIKYVLINGSYINLEATYTIVTTDWIFNSKVFPMGEIISVYPDKIATVVAEYAQGMVLSESYGERIKPSESLQEQNVIAKSRGRSQQSFDPDKIEVNYSQHEHLYRQDQQLKLLVVALTSGLGALSLLNYLFNRPAPKPVHKSPYPKSFFATHAGKTPSEFTKRSFTTYKVPPMTFFRVKTTFTNTTAKTIASTLRLLRKR